ncbi:MAG: sulfatase-like hydrolase/transferase, partial [Verrucomicrobiota bacterium]
MTKNLLSILFSGFLSLALVQAGESRPNIVFMFADDLGYGDLACYGHPYAETPNLDQLASEGTRFTQFYVTGVTCNPSRTGLMTGIHPARFPKYASDFGFGDRVSITEMLRNAGYRTGHFGKWHIGPDEEDGTYGLEEVDVIGGDHKDPEGRDTALYKAAEQFIRDHSEEPFYINIWGHSTHFPVHTVPSLAGKFEHVKVDRADFSETMQTKFEQSADIDADLDASMRQYLADVYSLDINVGRILKTIDELGIRENTIVVFSSDHGPAPVVLGKKGVREFSKNMLGYAGEYRGGKHNQLEGGTRVPFIVR